MPQILLFVLLLVSANLFSQNQNIQKLKSELNQYNVANQNRTTISAKDSIKVNILVELATELYTDYPDQATIYLNQIVDISKNIGLDRQLGKAYVILGVISDSVSDYPRALNYYLLALKMHKKAKNPIGEMVAYYNIGVLYGKQANYPEALQFMLKGLAIAKAEKDDPAIIGGYNNIGVLYLEQGRHELALNNFLEALSIMKKRNDTSYVDIVNQNIGDIYLLKKKFKEALWYYNEGLRMSILAGNKESESNNFHGIGRVFLEQKNYKEAIANLQKALQIRLAINEAYWISDSYITLGNAYQQINDIPRAIQNLEKGLALVKQSGELNLAKEAYKHLAEAHKSTGNYRLAYEYQTLYKQTTDSIFNIEKDKKLTELQMNYEFDKKQEAARELQKEKDAATLLAANKQRTLNFSVIIALVIVSGVAFTVSKNLRRNKRQQKLIEEQKTVLENQNELIQMSLTEKDTLLREIHHRVKNNLQIISSLLNIQSEDIQDEKVLLSIQEGQSRVEAMSLIHQNLYQSEHLNNVDIENYIRELVDYLSKMYRGQSDNVNVEITAALRFDIDTAIPLGLIVNELVSNAFKYGFENGAGNLFIAIKATDEAFELTVANDGKPLPDDFEIRNTKSLGLKLVSMLSRQLRGSFSAGTHNGHTTFTVTFRDLKAWQALN